MSRRTIIIIIVLVLIVAIVGYLIWKKNERRKRQDLLAGADVSGGKASTPSSGSGGGGYGGNDEFPLKVGKRGNNVLAMQIAINQGCTQLSENIVEDGIFGPQTEAAVDICFGDMNGHVKGQVSYAEYQSMRKAVANVEDLDTIRNLCSSSWSAATVKPVYGKSCKDFAMQYGWTDVLASVFWT